MPSYASVSVAHPELTRIVSHTTTGIMPVDTNEAIHKLQAENAAMEAEIAAITASGGDTKNLNLTKQSTSSSNEGIKVIQFGNANSSTNYAGINNGSAWCPPQTHRRTLLGGFFTS